MDFASLRPSNDTSEENPNLTFNRAEGVKHKQVTFT